METFQPCFLWVLKIRPHEVHLRLKFERNPLGKTTTTTATATATATTTTTTTTTTTICAFFSFKGHGKKMGFWKARVFIFIQKVWKVGLKRLKFRTWTWSASTKEGTERWQFRPNLNNKSFVHWIMFFFSGKVKKTFQNLFETTALGELKAAPTKTPQFLPACRWVGTIPWNAPSEWGNSSCLPCSWKRPPLAVTHSTPCKKNTCYFHPPLFVGGAPLRIQTVWFDSLYVFLFIQSGPLPEHHFFRGWNNSSDPSKRPMIWYLHFHRPFRGRNESCEGEQTLQTRRVFPRSKRCSWLSHHWWLSPLTFLHHVIQG